MRRCRFTLTRGFDDDDSEKPAAEKAVDEETRRALESLGYLESP